MSLAGGFFRVGAPQVKTLPIAIPEDEQYIEIIECMVDEMQNSLSDDVYEKIDKEIFKIYGLNNDEERLIRENMRKEG